MKCVLQSLPNTIHVILLTETWIRTETQALELQISNYSHYYNYRTDIRGGGVSAYVHNDLKHSLTESTYKGGNNYLWIRLERYALEVGVIYNPGDTNYPDFLEVYESQLQQRKRSIVFGDFNIDLLIKDKKTKQYKEMLKGTGHTIINKIGKKYCTRESNTRKSILDHVSSDLKGDYFHVAIIDSPMSDHKQIYVELKKTKSPRKIRTQYEAINFTKLYNLLETTDLDVSDNDYPLLENKIKLIIDKSKTTKTKILNLPQNDWINKTIINDISQRNALWAELKKSPNDTALKAQFNTTRKRVAQEIQNTKDAYYYKKFNDCVNKPKHMWNLVNTLANNKIKQNCAPSKLLVDSKYITDPNEICQIFNKYFATIGPVLAKDIPKSFHDDHSHALPKLPSDISLPPLSTFDPCSAHEVEKIISNLDQNCSTGLDGISTKAIKCAKNLISSNLSKSFNKLLVDGNFPDTLKMAKVTPIYKSGSKVEPGNYRPISVLPVLSKLLEKILHNRLYQYLSNINFLSDRQYGFRPKCSTLTATIDLVTKIKQNIDNKNIVLGIFIDLKKAFDTVSHNLLLKKLESINITGSALKMLKSYLTNRSQQVIMDINYRSDALPITCGIPQGSILGPLLFIIYINNIQELKLHGHINLYADDTCLFYFGSSIHDLVSQAQDDLNTLTSWFQYNLLTINISKTCYILFKAKNKMIPPHLQLNINNVPLQQKSNEKYLGLILDKSLSWNAHLDKIKTKLSSLLGSLRNIVRCIPHRLRHTIYNALVKPHLLYLVEIWGSAAKTKLANLQVTQNKLIKMIFNYPFLTATSKIYEETKIMNIRQLYIYQTCIFIHKVLNKTIKTNISFIRKKQVTQRSTRRASFLILPKIRTKLGKTNVTYEGAQLYNKIPSCIRNLRSFNAFKTQLAQYLIKNSTFLQH